MPPAAQLLRAMPAAHGYMEVCSARPDHAASEIGDMVSEMSVRGNSPDSVGEGPAPAQAGCAPHDKRSKHKKVEQNRRQLTKELVSELQNVLPTLSDAGPGVGINVVLEGTLDYLRDKNQPQDGNSGGDGVMGGHLAAPDNSMKMRLGGRICRGMSNIKYEAAFDSAPFGIVVARLPRAQQRSLHPMLCPALLHSQFPGSRPASAGTPFMA